MKRRDFLKAVGLSAASLAMQGCRAQPERIEPEPVPEKKLNFVFIIIDDLGWRDIGLMGRARGLGQPRLYYETRNIDKLAGQGVVFTSAYSNVFTPWGHLNVASPICES
jgi:hypothetical protein